MMNPKNFITHIKHLKVNTYPNNSSIKQIYIYQQINELLFIILSSRNNKAVAFYEKKNINAVLISNNDLFTSSFMH
jgi:hypothetical protein